MEAIQAMKTHKGDDPVAPIPTVIPHPTDYQVATHDGFRALWVVFVVMLISSAIFALRSWKVPIQLRAYHVATTTATIVAALSYYAMATGHANSFSCHSVTDEHNHGIPDTSHDECRQIYWGRYVDWAITTPLLVLDLSLLAGISGGNTIIAILASEITVLGKLFGSFGYEKTGQKWGWYAISCVSYLVLLWQVGLQGRNAIQGKGQKLKKLFTGLGAFTVIVWTIYPVVWGLAEGSRRVTVDSEIIAYAVLDVIAKVVFGTWLLVAQRKTPETNVEVGGYWAHGFGQEGRIRLATDEEA